MLPSNAFAHAPFWEEDQYVLAHQTVVPVSIRTNPLKKATIDHAYPVP